MKSKRITLGILTSISLCIAVLSVPSFVLMGGDFLSTVGFLMIIFVIIPILSIYVFNSQRENLFNIFIFLNMIPPLATILHGM